MTRDEYARSFLESLDTRPDLIEWIMVQPDAALDALAAAGGYGQGNIVKHHGPLASFDPCNCRACSRLQPYREPREGTPLKKSWV